MDKLRRYFVPALLVVMVGVQAWAVVELVNLRSWNRLHCQMERIFLKDIRRVSDKADLTEQHLSNVRATLLKDEPQ